MAELSKTARSSMGRVVKEVHVETTEEAIHQIRLNRAAGLFIGDMSRVDKLLIAYDKVVAEAKILAEAGVELIKTIIPEAFVPADSIRMAEVDNSERPEDHEHCGHGCAVWMAKVDNSERPEPVTRITHHEDGSHDFEHGGEA
jgi:hypothetical protein